MKSPLGRLDTDSFPHYQHKLADVIRQEKPDVVVETGLETGFGAEHILQALDDNGKGHLYSIDPASHQLLEDHPLDHPRFTWIKARSQDALSGLLERVGKFDMFIHDSDHGPECQLFEYEFAWEAVRSGGIIVSDDCFWGDPAHMTWTDFLKRHGINDAKIIGNAQYFRRP